MGVWCPSNRTKPIACMEHGAVGFFARHGPLNTYMIYYISTCRIPAQPVVKNRVFDLQETPSPGSGPCPAVSQIIPTTQRAAAR